MKPGDKIVVIDERNEGAYFGKGHYGVITENPDWVDFNDPRNSFVIGDGVWSVTSAEVRVLNTLSITKTVMIEEKQEVFAKPCPFCGKTDTLQFDGDEGDGQCYVLCNYIKDGCGSKSGYGKDEGKAMELWNTREGG